MNKVFYPFALLLIASVIFTGCRTNDDPTPYGDSIAVNLQTNIPARTRVINNQWQANDQVGLFMVQANQTLSNASIVGSNHNVQMTVQGSGLTSNPPVLFPRNNVGFIAYFPFQHSVGSNFTIPVTVGDQNAGLPTEVLFSNNITNQAPTENPVTLTFRYSLAKLEITVRGGDNSTLTAADFANMTASIEGVYTQADLQLATGTFANHSANQTIRLHRTGNTATSASFEALVLPVSGQITFVFDIDGVMFRRAMTVNYAAATLYQLPFVLDFPSATLLTTVIIPRDVNTSPDISVDATPSASVSVIRAENIVGNFSEVATVRGNVWREEWDGDRWIEHTFTVSESPFVNNGFTLHLNNNVPDSFLFPLDYDGDYYSLSDIFFVSDKNARGTSMWELLAFNRDGHREGGFYLRDRIRYADGYGYGYSERYEAFWIYVDRDVVIRGTYSGENEWWSWEESIDVDLRRGWNIVYSYGYWNEYFDTNIGKWTGTDIWKTTTQRPTRANFSWGFWESRFRPYMEILTPWALHQTLNEDAYRGEDIKFIAYAPWTSSIREWQTRAEGTRSAATDWSSSTRATATRGSATNWLSPTRRTLATRVAPSSVATRQGSTVDWLFLSPDRGWGEGHYTVTPFLSPNTEYNRAAVITITNGYTSFEIFIGQTGPKGWGPPPIVTPEL